MSGIEQVMVMAILALAGGYLCWSMYGFFRGAPQGCGSACSRCPSHDRSPQTMPLVTLDAALPADRPAPGK